MRAWLLTWTTYGTWLPGDKRGSVTRVRESRDPRQMHNAPGTLYDSRMPGLEAAAQHSMRGQPIFLTRAQAERITAQFIESAACRGWRL
jgi:hypothetical protein